MSGPIRVTDTDGRPAMPGDLLVVEILNLGPLPGDEWGFTGIFDRENGGGFLTDHFPNACKAIWDFEGIFASSRHIPGIVTLEHSSIMWSNLYVLYQSLCLVMYHFENLNPQGTLSTSVCKWNLFNFASDYQEFTVIIVPITAWQFMVMAPCDRKCHF